MNVKEIMKNMNGVVLPHHRIESKLINYIKNEFGVEISTSTVIPTPFGIVSSMALSIMLSRKKEYKDIPISSNLKPLRFSINYEEGWEQELLSGVVETLTMWGFNYEEDRNIMLWLEWALRPLTQERLDAQSSYLSKRGDTKSSDTGVEEIEETSFLSGLSD